MPGAIDALVAARILVLDAGDGGTRRARLAHACVDHPAEVGGLAVEAAIDRSPHLAKYPPLLEADVRFGRFKRLGGDPLALLDDYIGGAPDSSADSGFVVRS